MKKFMAILMVLGVMGVLMAGCGGGSDDSSKAGAASPKAGDATKTADGGK